MDHQQFKAGDLILKQGDLGCNAYRILSGQVEVFSMRGVERIVLGRLGPGEIFGEMGMIEDKSRSASVTALEETKVEVVTPKAFNEMVLRDPEHLVPYLKSFFERLRRANERSFSMALALSSSAARSSEVLPSSFVPAGSVRMLAKTDHLRQRLSKSDWIVHRFPFRIGRWSENSQVDVFVSNDLLIRDEAPFLISRNHCAIEREGDRYGVLDRGSAFGTIVNGKKIGGTETQMVAPLHFGENEIQLGGENSPYCFQVLIS